MPFARPSRSDLIARVQGDFNAWVSGVDATLRRSFIGVFSRLHGMAMDNQYGYLDWIARQIHPTTADEEMLMRAARLWLPVPRYDATFAAGSVILSGSAGIDVPAGTIFVRADGALFSTAADASFISNSLMVSCFANVAGSAGNCAASSVLALQSPIAGVQNSLTVSEFGIVGGADLESLESVLARLQKRIQTPPQGGDGDDYVAWIFAALPTVTRAWCFPGESGLGNVTLRFMCDGTYSNGIPLSGDVAIVAAYLANKRPVTAQLITVAPVANPVNFTISSLSPSTAAIKAAITANLQAVFTAQSSPGGEYWDGYSTATGGSIFWSHLEEAVANTPGVIDFTLSSPSANIVTSSPGIIPTLGAIAWS